MTLKARLTAKLGNGADIIIYSKRRRLEPHRTNGTDIHIGCSVTEYGETKPDIDLTGNGEVELGVVHSPAYAPCDLSVDGNSSTDKYDDDYWVNVWVPDSGDIGFICGATDSTKAITQGKRLTVTGGYYHDFAYTDGSVATDTLISSYWIAEETEASGTTRNVFVQARRA